mmetsp:Transcript_17598/g.42212  ORF Transcript_17598/g.42212 Transcript_17598/m.42212 type:complete len:417 (+) Transcript_17598:173-1423(+)
MEPESCPSFSDQVLLCFSGDSGAGACAALGLGFEHGHGFEAVPLSIPLRLKEFSVKLRGGLLEEVGASSPVLVLRRRDDGRLGPTAVVVNAAFDRDDQARVAHWLVSQIPVTAEKVVVVLSDEPQTPSPGRDSCRLQCAAWGGLVPAPGLSDLELMPDGLRIRDGLAAAAVHFLVAEQRPCCCVVSPGSQPFPPLPLMPPIAAPPLPPPPPNPAPPFRLPATLPPRARIRGGTWLPIPDPASPSSHEGEGQGRMACSELLPCPDGSWAPAGRRRGLHGRIPSPPQHPPAAPSLLFGLGLVWVGGGAGVQTGPRRRKRGHPRPRRGGLAARGGGGCGGAPRVRAEVRPREAARHRAVRDPHRLAGAPRPLRADLHLSPARPKEEEAGCAITRSAPAGPTSPGWWSTARGRAARAGSC